MWEMGLPGLCFSNTLSKTEKRRSSVHYDSRPLQVTSHIGVEYSTTHAFKFLAPSHRHLGPSCFYLWSTLRSSMKIIVKYSRVAWQVPVMISNMRQYGFFSSQQFFNTPPPPVRPPPASSPVPISKTNEVHTTVSSCRIWLLVFLSIAELVTCM